MINKKSCVLANFLMLVTTLLFYSQGFAFTNEPDGFKEIKWGTHISKLKNLKYIYSKGVIGDIKVYKMDNDMRSFGGAEIDKIEYEFYKERFVSVSLKVKDLYNFIKLKKYCFKEFGMGKEIVKELEQYYWIGKKVIVTLISKHDIS